MYNFILFVYLLAFRPGEIYTTYRICAARSLTRSRTNSAQYQSDVMYAILGVCAFTRRSDTLLCHSASHSLLLSCNALPPRRNLVLAPLSIRNENRNSSGSTYCISCSSTGASESSRSAIRLCVSSGAGTPCNGVS